jgi:hypothetical protein
MLLVGSPARSAEGPEGSPDGWVSVDYGEIVDRRQLTHSGESVGTVLERLAGQPAPAAGQRSRAARDHDLLDPVLEAYAHVLPDALDSLDETSRRRWVEVGWLWEPGEAAPAWVELLRARRAVVETDGRGTLRIFAPLDRDASSGGAEREPGERAWARSGSWLRHVVAAERRRQAAGGQGESELRVEVYAYRHRPAETTFELHLEPYGLEGDPTAPPATAPPLDLDELERFLKTGLRIEGGRLEGGRLRLIGSETDSEPSLGGAPVGLADLAVAHRAVVHGGRPNPSMSLDRGLSPHRSRVTYGGRLADTKLGLVSLLCDVRFKTFSQGIDPGSGEDVRARIRQKVPGFQTHIERFAAHPDRGQDVGQQTRLWFYPDEVGMLVDPEGGMAALSQPRMTAAAERVELSGGASQEAQPPWTRALTLQINDTYDQLAGPFPELAELDQVVRLLSLFTWLDFAGEQGRAVPDLDALLAVELPALRTPRSYPQLLAFDAFPATPSEGRVDVFPRPDVSRALDRLTPSEGGPLPARARLFRALAALDRSNPAHAALIEELSRTSPAQLQDADLDALAYRAERLRMHQLVIETLSREQRAQLRAREQGGDPVEVLSVAIGGLDLDMGAALRRGAGRSRRLALVGEASPQRAALGAGPTAGDRGSARAEPPDHWRQESAGLPVTSLPALEAEGPGARRLRSWDRKSDLGREIGVVHLPLARDVRARVLRAEGDGAALQIDRVEGSRRYRYTIEGGGGEYTVSRADEDPVSPSPVAERLAADPPEGLFTLALSRAGRAAADGTGSTLVRLHARQPGKNPRAVDLPRTAVQALLLGQRLAPRAGRRALREVARLGNVSPGAGRTVMVMEDFSREGAPWEVTPYPRPGEEDPRNFARAVSESAREGTGVPMRAVVGLDPSTSPERWRGAARPLGGAFLLLPDGGFPGPAGKLRGELVAAWPEGRAAAALPEGDLPGLVVLASAEPPGVLATRALELAADPRMADRHLAVIALAGSLRADVAGRALAEGRIASLGLAGVEPLAWQGVAASLGQLGRAAREAGDGDLRPERLDGPFVWVY